jgi:Ca-activated chloride channel family protein
LSIRYGIVTPYTSYLVTEEMPLGEAEQGRIAEEAYAQSQSMPTAAPSGQEAVQKSADQSALAGAESAYAPPAEVANVVRIVGARTFVLADGVWMDTGFDPEEMKAVKVAFLSPDYFALAKAHPELAAAFALGQHVIAMAKGVAYEVVSEDTPVQPVELMPTSTPEVEQAQPGDGVTPEQERVNIAVAMCARYPDVTAQCSGSVDAGR